VGQLHRDNRLIHPSAANSATAGSDGFEPREIAITTPRAARSLDAIARDEAVLIQVAELP
jgi:hypothetical protein